MSVVEACVAFDRLVLRKSASRLRPGGGGSLGPFFPPRSTVYNIFRAFQREGMWERIWEELRAALRERLGREASPSAGVIDSGSLKSAEKGDARKVKQTQWVTTPARR